MTEASHYARAGQVAVSRQLLDDIPRFEFPLHLLCYHPGIPPATKDAGIHYCASCDTTFLAMKKRPPRDPGGYCYECGHTTSKGAKRKKRWTWTAIP